MKKNRVDWLEAFGILLIVTGFYMSFWGIDDIREAYCEEKVQEQALQEDMTVEQQLKMLCLKCNTRCGQ